MEVASGTQTNGLNGAVLHSVGLGRVGLIVCDAVGAEVGTAVSSGVEVPTQYDFARRVFVGDSLSVLVCIDKHNGVDYHVLDDNTRQNFQGHVCFQTATALLGVSDFALNFRYMLIFRANVDS